MIDPKIVHHNELCKYFMPFDILHPVSLNQTLPFALKEEWGFFAIYHRDIISLAIDCKH